jgi:hypothetical protein
MTELILSRREETLLGAALNPNGAVAARCWEDWAAEISLENAPYAELRLLPAVYAHLTRVAPALELPEKLRGKARATFARNHLLAQGSSPAIEALSRHSPLLLAKGLAMCIRFKAWSARTMGDVDIHVPYQSLAKVCAALAEADWIPRYGMTWASLLHRSSLRRNSWNFSKGNIDLDLHWRVAQGPAEDWLTRNMWASAERVELYGRTALVQSPEFALITALSHGLEGTRADVLQTLVDAASLLPICQADRLAPLLDKTDLGTPYRHMIAILDSAGSTAAASGDWTRRRGLSAVSSAGEASAASGPIRRFRQSRADAENAVLDRPARYWLREAIGRNSRFERLLLRLTGPLSKPLAYSGSFQSDYDLRDCAVIDEIGGPGWGWPEPEHTCFWADRADARLLIPLANVCDHVIVLGIGDYRSLNTSFEVFANGTFLATLNLNESLSTFEHCIFVARSVLFGPWVELSLRPKPYLGDGNRSSSDYALRRSVPARRLRVFEMRHLGEFFSKQHISPLKLKILDAEEPQVGKFMRIKKTIENSTFRHLSEIPADFDPVLYVLSYPDLLEAEVDPYEHFVAFGRHEGRLWR